MANKLPPLVAFHYFTTASSPYNICTDVQEAKRQKERCIVLVEGMSTFIKEAAAYLDNATGVKGSLGVS
jgi:hypothetical protein